jgi:hypothetical protein
VAASAAAVAASAAAAVVVASAVVAAVAIAIAAIVVTEHQRFYETVFAGRSSFGASSFFILFEFRSQETRNRRGIRDLGSA